MSREYPRIGRTFNHKKNTCAKCKCGETGRYKVDIQWSFMRGEDSTVWACENHKSDINFLSGNYSYA